MSETKIFKYIYEVFGIDGISQVLGKMRENDPKAYEAFIEHQALDKKHGRPYFVVKSTNPLKLEKVENIQIANFKDYVKLAVRTDATSQSHVSDRILHSIVGLVGELSEAVEIYRKYDKEGYCSSSDYEAFVSELGDVLWHIALYYDATEIFRDKGENDPLVNFINKGSFPGLMQCLDNDHLRGLLNEYSFQNIITNFRHSGHMSNIVEVFLEKAAKALDAFKKHYFYKQKLSHEKHALLMSNLCVDILEWMIVTSYLESEIVTYSLKEIMKANIKKLKARYPEKFTVEDSLNRDYKKESKESGLTVK